MAKTIDIKVDVERLRDIDPIIGGKESGFVLAAIQEYVDMMSGEKVFSRASDIREYRLLLLIENAFEEMPSENVVANLFQLKRSEARTLVKNVDAKYRRRLIETKKKSLYNVINSIDTQQNTSDYEFNCDSPIKIEFLNELLSQDYEIIQKVSNKMNRYKINADTLNYLLSKLN